MERKKDKTRALVEDHIKSIRRQAGIDVRFMTCRVFHSLSKAASLSKSIKRVKEGSDRQANRVAGDIQERFDIFPL